MVSAAHETKEDKKDETISSNGLEYISSGTEEPIQTMQCLSMVGKLLLRKSKLWRKLPQFSTIGEIF